MLSQSAWFRPHNKSEELDRLFLVGAGTHPGAGLPGRAVLRPCPGFRGAPCQCALTAAPPTCGPTSPCAAPRFAPGRAASIWPPLLLPRAVRDPASALYAFCRQADDAVDVGGQRDAVDRLRRRLALAYAGLPVAIPADRALADVVARFGIPYALPDAMLEGFAWDAEGRRYQDFSALKSYAARVAGSGRGDDGRVDGCALSPEQLARACDLGVAMQLSNIARDVGEDAQAGRIYLPLDWMHEAGIDPAAWLLRPVCGCRLG